MHHLIVTSIVIALVAFSFSLAAFCIALVVLIGH